MRDKFLSGIFFAVLFLSGCNLLSPHSSPATAKKPTGDVVAEVNGDYITLDEFNKEVDAVNTALETQNPNMKIDTVEKKREYLKDMVNRKLLYQEALARGLDRDAEFETNLTNFKTTILVQKLVGEEMRNEDVSAQDVEKVYQEVKGQLKEPDQLWLREIVVETKQGANDILAEILRGADFATIAKEKSKASSAANGGDLGFISAGSKGKDFVLFDEMVFSPNLEVGSTTGVFKGPDGYYLVKLEEKKSGRQATLAEVQDKIKATLVQQKQQEKIKAIIDKLYAQKQAKIIINDAQIK